MTVLPDGLSLAAEFPDPTREQWSHLVEGVLRKAGVTDVPESAAEDALATEIEDGLTARPALHRARRARTIPASPGFAPFVRGGQAMGNSVSGWDVRQRHALPDPKRANEAVLADLENGVTSLWLTVGEGGVPVDGVRTVLDGVLPRPRARRARRRRATPRPRRARSCGLVDERGVAAPGGARQPRRGPPQARWRVPGRDDRAAHRGRWPAAATRSTRACAR